MAIGGSQKPDALTDALATLIPAITAEPAPDAICPSTLREALRHYASAPPSRAIDRPPAITAALRWLEKASLPVSMVSKRAWPRGPRRDLRAPGRQSRQRDHHRPQAVRFRQRDPVRGRTGRNAYAPSWNLPEGLRGSGPPRRRQPTPSTRTAHGRYLCRPATPRASCMRPAAHGVYAACSSARAPGEAVGLRRQDCYLPAAGWGRLTLEKSRPEVNRRWTRLGPRRTRAQAPGRRARPCIPPELVAILRTHIGIATRGYQQRPGPAHRLHRHQRCLGRSPDPCPDSRPRSPPPSLAAPTTCATQPIVWLAAGVPAPRVAERGRAQRRSRVYAKCLDDGGDIANTPIDAALRDA